MAISNTRFEEARAREWQNNVRAEIDETSRVLNEIAPVLQNYDEEDDVLNAMKTVGNNLEEKFTNVCYGFNESINIVEAAINKMAEFVVNAIQAIEDKAQSMR